MASRAALPTPFHDAIARQMSLAAREDQAVEAALGDGRGLVGSAKGVDSIDTLFIIIETAHGQG